MQNSNAQRGFFPPPPRNISLFSDLSLSLNEIGTFWSDGENPKFSRVKNDFTGQDALSSVTSS